MGSGTQGDADDAFAGCQATGCTADQQKNIEQLDSDAASQSTIGTIGLVGGGVAVAGGVTLLILGLTAKPEPQKTGWIAPYVAPNGVGVHGAF